MALKPQPDILFLIRARIDSGSRRGAPQLRKDVQVLKKAEAEIERQRTELATFRPQTPERQPEPGQQWKCGDEFLPFHPQASHVPPDYRDGWNRCYWMAVNRGVPLGDGGQKR